MDACEERITEMESWCVGLGAELLSAGSLLPSVAAALQPLVKTRPSRILISSLDHVFGEVDVLRSPRRLHGYIEALTGLSSNRGGDVRSPLSPTSASSDEVTCKSSVHFDLDAVTFHEVIPYAEVYGRHPQEFVFNRHSEMVILDGVEEVLDEKSEDEVILDSVFLLEF